MLIFAPLIVHSHEGAMMPCNACNLMNNSVSSWHEETGSGRRRVAEIKRQSYLNGRTKLAHVEKNVEN